MGKLLDFPSRPQVGYGGRKPTVMDNRLGDFIHLCRVHGWNYTASWVEKRVKDLTKLMEAEASLQQGGEE
jgi:hypothetical protein